MILLFLRISVTSISIITSTWKTIFKQNVNYLLVLQVTSSVRKKIFLRLQFVIMIVHGQHGYWKIINIVGNSIVITVFQKQKCKWNIIITNCNIRNIDSPWAARLLENCPADIITYGIDQQADV